MCCLTGSTRISRSMKHRNKIGNDISIFYVDQSDEHYSDIRRLRPTPEMQDGGSQAVIRHLAIPASDDVGGVRMVFTGLAGIENVEI
jgi:hypothetical protein